MHTSSTLMSTIWKSIQGAAAVLFQPISASYGTAFTALAANHGLTRHELAHFCYVIENFDRYRLSVSAYRRRSPYDRPEAVLRQFELWSTAGLLQRDIEGSFSISSAGEAAWLSRWELANGLLAGISALPPKELFLLNGFLDRVTAAIGSALEPPSQWAFRMRRARGRKKVRGACPLWQFHSRRMDLLAFRDDAHLAAWQEHHDLTGYAWEAMSLLWAGSANSVASVAEMLGYRGEGHTAMFYADVLNELVKTGWVETLPAQEFYWISDSGKLVRERAELETDRFFFATWECLSVQELELLHELLARLIESLRNSV